MKKQYLLLITMILCLSKVIAQNSFGKVPLTKIEATFQKSTDQSILFSELKPISGITFRLVKTETDKLGMTHRTYQQYYNGIKVDFGVLKIHEKKGVKQTFNGAYFKPETVRTSPSVSKFQLQNIAKNYMKSNAVFWLDEDGISKTNTPTPELVILPNRRTSTLNLAYAIGVGSTEPELKMGILYVDATTGATLKYKNLVFTCFENTNEEAHESHKIDTTPSMLPFVSGTGATVYSGSQTIETTLDGSDYTLYDQSRANTGSSHDTGIATKNGIATVNINHSATLTDYSNASVVTEFTDGNNNWTAANMSSDEDQYALDAHWGAQVVYDYFNAEHSKESYDGNDSAIVSYVHYDTDYTNAAWVSFSNNRGFMIYGDGGGSFTPLTSLDVAAHEIAHGITNNTAQLDYELESGALNEGFSDVWAMVIENYANNNLGTSKDIALINDENGGGALRSMSNPNAYSLPDTYGGTYWYDVTGCTPDLNTNDYCGVHTNSGVLSYWFWLLSQGGSGTNDNGDAFTVTALGMDDAAAIAYRMQNTYLTATSDYADARAAGIQAAIDLYGDFCTTQEEAVTNAFYAVGVGSAWSANGQSPTITTDIVDQTVCVGIDQVQLTAAATDWTNKRWQVNTVGSWDNLSNGGYYANTYSNTMRINNPDASLNGNRYRVYYENNCGKTYSSVMTLTVFENPVATVDALSDETCSGDSDGTMTVSFPDDSNQTNIEFSIDGGVTYPYSYLDNLGTQTITDLSAATYNVWVRWGEDDCPVELGDNTINTVTCVAYTAIPDANFEARLDELGYDDIPGDGQVPTAVIEAVTALFINSSSITDLTGIEAFTALEILNCNTNTIVNLDLSANTNLNNLNCSSNDIATINISNNLLLEELSCSNNELTTLDVTNNNLLTEIRTGSNQLTSIDLSNNTLLESLTIDGNTITTLDLSANTALNNLNIFNNTIGDLNLDQNTNIEYLDFGDNPLTSIDLSNNVSLIEIYAYDGNLMGSFDLSNHPLLTDIDFTNNDLTSLDVRSGGNTNILSFTTTGNTNLTCIYVDDVDYSTTNWTDIDAGHSFTDTDYCDYTAIPDTNFEAKLEALGYDDISADGQVPTALIEVITSLDIRSSSITNLTGLEDFTALETLLCRANGIDTIDISQNLLLETFTANNNSIGTIDLSNNTALKSVNLGANGLSTLDVSNNTLLEELSLQSSGGLSTLDVSNNTLLKELKTYNSGISTLDISNNIALEILQIYSTSIAAIDVTNNPDLKDFRVHNTNITTLDLSNNPNIEQLRVNGTNIESLDLSNQVALRRLHANDMNLNALNVQNGNNSNITVFRLTNNPSLSCILVDDAAYSISNWTEIDAGVTFSDTYCRYTTIPDANFEAWLEGQGYDDISSDGQVPTALIEVVTSITPQFEDILDFTGLEDFTALESLAVSYNSFTDLDVSNNTNLTFLNCGYSLLANLDVSNNSLLETLWVNNTNLSALDLSLNTNLTSLTASAISNLTTLNMQNGNNTNVTNFTTGGNSNLTCILVDNLLNDYSSWNKEATTNFSDTYCGYTLIPDANFEARLEALGYDDISADGQVPTALIEVVTTLDVSSKSIADLTGIEAFIALTDLDCEVNDLTSLDLSNNTLLEEIDCDGNSTLTSLNFGNNTNLKTIICNQNSMLTTLDLSNNTGLESVQITNNGLTSLNVANLTNLQTLYCSGNSLSSLDVTQSVNLENLICAENTISALDVSNNTLLTYLSVADNDLTTIDVTNNIALLYLLLNENELTTLDVTNNTNLKWLYTHSNLLTILDVSQNSLLEKLWTNDNSISTLDVTSNTALTELMCYENMLTSLDVSNNVLLNWLYCSNNSITSLDVTNNTALTSFTCNHNSLTSLNLQNGNNTNLSFRIMANNPDLTCILVDDADYSNTNWDIDKDATANFNDTYCDYTAIPDANFEAALDALGYDDISSDGQVPTALIEVVTNLDVSSESISNLTGIEDFAALLDLNIQDNSLSNIDLSNNILLEDLNCAHNNFFYLDLSTNTVLNSLYANNNYLLELDVSANTQLQYLYLVDNQLNYLNYQNGNNTNNLFFNATGNSNLNCILVDDVAYSTTNWTDIDNHTSFSNTYCRYTSIPDVNFEAALEALGYDDITADGQVPTVLIEGVTLMDINNENIADLTGIEDFEALEALDCSGNQLTEINLGSNVPLTYLDISSNNLNLLETPTSIVNLIANSNNIVFLDLKEHTALEELSIYNNNLIYLNLQNGTNTNIFNLITTNNPDLTCIIVDDAAYSTTNWTNIDATTSFSLTYCKYTQIPDSNFEARLENLGYDDISGDGQVPTALIIDVQFLDVSFSSSGAIYDLTGIEDFYSLDNIFLTDNLMTSIDVSSNNFLLQFNANNTALTSVDLSSNPALNFVTLSDSDDLSSVNLQNGTNTNFVGSSSFTAVNVPNLSCVLVDSESYANATWVNHIDPQISFNEVSCSSVTIAPKVFLQGALLNPNVGEETWMRDDLRIADGLYGGTSPYGDGVRIDEGIGGDDAGANSTVDWIWVELRDATDPTIVIAGQSAILQRDGDVVDVATDRITPLTFVGVEEDDYYVVIKHRNHLGIMTANALTLSTTSTAIDFTDANNEITYGTDAQTTFGMPSGVVAMWAGDANGDGQLNYLGGSSDVPSIRSQVFNDPDNSVFGGPPLGTYQSEGYTETDVNMDSVTVYSGGTSDILFIRDNIFNNPSNSIFGGPPLGTYLFIQQLPEGANN